jgi:hypothetical protein
MRIGTTVVARSSKRRSALWFVSALGLILLCVGISVLIWGRNAPDNALYQVTDYVGGLEASRKIVSGAQQNKEASYGGVSAIIWGVLLLWAGIAGLKKIEVIGGRG